MNREFKGLPQYTPYILGNVRADADYFLSKKDVRRYLLFGAILSCIAIASPVFIIESVMVAISNIEWFYMVALQNVMMFVSIIIGLFLIFPAFYCGMYRIILKASKNERISANDLFFFFKSGKHFFRSIAIFLYSGWYIFGFLIYYTFSQIAAGIISGITDQNQINKISGAVGAVFIAYLIFATIVMLVRRKYNFVFVPYAVENHDVPLGRCRYTAKRMRVDLYDRSSPGPFIQFFGMTILSLFTIGILFVIYVGPLMMTRKVSFYRNSMSKDYNNYDNLQ